MTKFNNKEKDKVYLISEIGSNHNQDKSLALEMIDMAAESGADAVKFQSIRFDKLYQHDYETDEFRRWFKKIELDENWYLDLAEQAKKSGVDFISAPTYIEAIELLEECNVPVYKLASPQVYGNLDIVRRVAQTGKPLIMSLGYSEYSDISKAIKAVENEGNNQITLLHCISKYPMKPKEANLRFIQTLQKMTGYPVGFSDHSLDDHLTMAAVAMGAVVIEKHVTLDRNMSGPDHNFAMTFNEFSRMESRIRDITLGLGDGVRLRLLKDEYIHRKSVELKVFSKVNIEKGALIDDSMLFFKRFSGGGIIKSDSVLLLGARVINSIRSGELIELKNIQILG
jgi:sialic acid synthase SpsE